VGLLARGHPGVERPEIGQLPTIDIRDLAGDDLARRQAVADAIGRAAREVGFFSRRSWLRFLFSER
jgi:hypothetical protein